MKKMYRIIFLALLLPILSFAQGKQKAKPAAKSRATVNKQTDDAGDGFLINGNITGYPEGTTVALLNGQTGATEMETTLKSNKFVLKGKMDMVDFKIILFNRQAPYITVFLDNSKVNITGTKDNIEKATITGSRSHNDFNSFNTLLDPYKQVFMENTAYDSVAVKKAMAVTEQFAKTHPSSAISALAIVRYNQLADDISKTEILYNILSPEVKAMPMGKYIEGQIAEEKKNAGVVLGDFSQADTSGNMIKLSSFRGKYVLLDFWASWCGPCRQENPNVVQAFNKYKNKNFTVLSVSLDKTKPAWLNAIQMDNLTWTHVSDLQGWSNSVALQYQIFSIPQNYLIDPNGKVIGKNLRGAALERRLAKVLR